jgi:hypothetical protein
MTNKIMLICVALAMTAALGYMLMGIGVIHPRDLIAEDAPPAIVWVMAGCYIVGGLLIFLKKRRLWITGTAINAFVVVMFMLMYAARPSVIFSAPGLITKIAQILLEIGLIYLIVKSKPEKSAVSAK